MAVQHPREARQWRIFVKSGHIHPPIDKTVNIVLCRDFSNRGYHLNLLVHEQCCELLHMGSDALRGSVKFLARRAKADSYRDASLLRQLKDMGVIEKKSGSVTLYSVRTIVELAAKTPHLQAVAADLDAMNLAHATMDAAVGAAPAQDDNDNGEEQDPPIPLHHPPIPYTYPTGIAFPQTLPGMQLTPSESRGRYGLLHVLCEGRNDPAKLPDRVPLKHDLASFKEYLTAPVYVGRGPTRAVGTKTWAEHLDTVSQFCGYVNKYMAVPLEDMSLLLFTNQVFLMYYVAFLTKRAKSGGAGGVNGHISNCRKVVLYLLSSEPRRQGWSEDKREHLESIIKMLGALPTQLRHAYPGRPRGSDDAPDEDLPSPSDLLPWQYSIMMHALVSLEREHAAATAEALLGAPRGSGTSVLPSTISYGTACMLRDACMVAWLSNHFPPLRLGALRQTQVYETAGLHHKCSTAHPDSAACKGNRLVLSDTQFYHFGQPHVSMQPTPAVCGIWYVLGESVLPLLTGAGAQAGSAAASPQSAAPPSVRLPAVPNAATNRHQLPASPAAAAVVGVTHQQQQQQQAPSSMSTSSSSASFVSASSGGGEQLGGGGQQQQSAGHGTGTTDSGASGLGAGDYMEQDLELDQARAGSHPAATAQPQSAAAAGPSSPPAAGGGPWSSSRRRPPRSKLALPAPLVPDRLPLMYVVLPHHKTEEWGDRPIRAVVPFELALITWLYVTHAHPVLYLGDDGRDRTPYLFMRWSKKQECFLPLEDSHLTGEWHRLNAACPWPAFPPVMLRHIHVEDRVQHLADMVRAGGSAADLRGDAVLMANTVGPVWEKHYLSGKAYNKLVNTALDAKTKWRREQLALIRPELDDMVTALDAAAVQAAVGGGAAAGGPSGQSEAMLLEEDGDC